MTKQDLQQIKEVFHSELQAELPILLRSELEAQLPALFKELFRSELEAQLPALFKELFRSELQTELPIQLGKFTEDIILPAIENIIDDKLKVELEPIKKDIAYLKMEIGVLKTRYPDKAYLDDKLSDLRGDFLANRKKDSTRVDEHIKIDYQRGNITKKDVEKLASLRAFAPLSVLR